jgi:hypothetical protein
MIRKMIIPIICLEVALLICSCQIKTDQTAILSYKNDPTVIAYYFHRTTRCSTCLAIEANAGSVIKVNYPQYIAEGTLIWKPFNLDDKGGEELRKQFDITSNTLVLAKIYDDKLVRYKKLEDVWKLIGNPEGFSDYVTTEIDKFMNDV